MVVGDESEGTDEGDELIRRFTNKRPLENAWEKGKD